MTLFRKNMTLMLITIIFTGLHACSAKVQPNPRPNLDSPEHYVFTGNKLLVLGDHQAAEEEFTRAIEMRSTYAPAHVGMAETHLVRGDADSAEETILTALKHEKSAEEEVLCRTTYMKVLLVRNGEGDFTSLSDQHERILGIDPDNQQANLLLGSAHVAQAEYAKAESLFAKVSGQGGVIGAKAEQMWKMVQDTRRITFTSRVQSNLSMATPVTRAQAAALIVEALDERLPKPEERKKAPAYQTPHAMELAQATPVAPLPTDIIDHEFKNDIRLVLQIGLRGLGADNDSHFRPDAPLLRSDLAMVIQDLSGKLHEEPIVRSTGASIFMDIPLGHYASGAIMHCVTRNFMTAESDGRFRPFEPVLGNELLLGLQESIGGPLPSRDAEYSADTSEQDIMAQLMIKALKGGMMFLL